MKKTFFLLLLSVFTYGQTTTGKETKFINGIRNTATQTVPNPTNIVTQGNDGTYGKISAGLIEKTENKQNSLTVDGTGSKYPTVDAVNTGLVGRFLTESGQTGIVFGNNSRDFYGNVGVGAFDFSVSEFASSVNGATGENSFAQGWNVISSGNTSASFGVDINNNGNVSAAFGYGGIIQAGTGNFINGGFNKINFGNYVTVVGQFSEEINNSNNVNSSTNTLFVVGNGLANNLGLPQSRSNAFTVKTSGLIEAPSLTNSLIDSGSNKSLVTKEWVSGVANPTTNRISKSNGSGRLVDSGFIEVGGNMGLGSAVVPGELFHIGDGNMLLEGGGEVAQKFKRDFTTTGEDLGVPTGSGQSVNPIFQVGRIIQAGDGDPEIRIMYSDDNTTERTVFEVDRKGIAASVKTGIGSHFEGFASLTDVNPKFRLNSYPRMRLEMGAGGNNITDVAVERSATGGLDFFTNSINRAGFDSAGNLKLLVNPATSSGSYDFLTRNNSTGAVERVSSPTLQQVSDAGKEITFPNGVNGMSLSSSDTGSIGNISALNISSFNNAFGITVSSQGSAGIYARSLNSYAIYASSQNGVCSSFAIEAGSYSDISNFTKGGVIQASISHNGIITSNGFVLNGTIRLKAYTVATLPTGIEGDTAYVTDALAPSYLVTVVGGGAIRTAVFYNGTNWVSH